MSTSVAAHSCSSSWRGSLAKRSATELKVTTGNLALEKINPALIDLVVVGNVLSAGLGMNVARQIGVVLGLPLSAPAYKLLVV